MPSPPEIAALELLVSLPRHVWDGASLPVPVEEIADSWFGLRVGEHDDLSALPGAPEADALSGLLVVDAREIWVNRDEAAASPGRRRFTVGHELGHWVLHREPHRRVFCRSHAVALDALDGDAPDMEEEASLFAGGLLFPDVLVRMEHARLGGDLQQLCERFGGSRVATERALFRAIRSPAVLEHGEPLEGFFWNDRGYDAWRAAHAADGHVVTESLATLDGRLHRAACSYLAGPAQPGRPRTRQPKWCATDPDALRRALPHARACARCQPS